MQDRPKVSHRDVEAAAQRFLGHDDLCAGSVPGFTILDSTGTNGEEKIGEPDLYTSEGDESWWLDYKSIDELLVAAFDEFLQTTARRILAGAVARSTKTIDSWSYKSLTDKRENPSEREGPLKALVFPWAAPRRRPSDVDPLVPVHYSRAVEPHHVVVVVSGESRLRVHCLGFSMDGQSPIGIRAEVARLLPERPRSSAGVKIIDVTVDDPQSPYF